MEQIQAIKAEIERLRRIGEISDDKDYAQYELDVKCGYDSALDDVLSFIESLEKEEQEDTDFVKQELERIREAEKKVKLPELIDFWWMQEDMEGNQMIAKNKEHFAFAMRKAYNVGLSQSESLEQEQFADETMMEKDKIDTAFTRMMEKEQPQVLNEAAEKDTLAERINEESKRFPEVSFAKLTRIAKHFYDFGREAGAKWQLAKMKETCDIVDREYLKAAMETEYERGKKWMAEQGITNISMARDLSRGIVCNISSKMLNDLGITTYDKVIVQIRKKDD